MNTILGSGFLASTLGVVLPLASHHAYADESGVGNGMKPSALFVQLGAAEHGQEGALGATWDLPWRRDLDCCVAAGYVEAAIGRC